MTKHSKYSHLPRDTMALISKRVRSAVDGEDFVNWAMRALMDGFDSPSLGILAGLDLGSRSRFSVDLFEAYEYFLRVIKELALPIPDIELALSFPDVWTTVPFPYDETALRRHLNELAEQIREGVIDPVLGIDRIHREVVDPLHHPSDLMPWCFLWEGNTPDGRLGEYSKEEYSMAIMTLATLWLKSVDDEAGG